MKSFTVSALISAHKIIQRGCLVFGCVALVLLLISNSNAEERLRRKDKVEITTLRKLVRTLITVEKLGLKQASDADKKAYKKVTLRLQEYINETVLSAGDDVVLYPKAIARVIADEVVKKEDTLTGKKRKDKLTKKQLAEKLETIYKEEEFEKIAEKIKRGELEDPSEEEERSGSYLKMKTVKFLVIDFIIERKGQRNEILVSRNNRHYGVKRF